MVFVVGFDYRDEGEYVLKDERNTELGGYGGDRTETLGLHSKDIEIGRASCRERVFLRV